MDNIILINFIQMSKENHEIIKLNQKILYIR